MPRHTRQSHKLGRVLKTLTVPDIDRRQLSYLTTVHLIRWRELLI